jgi:hypothetical protein
MCLKGKEQQNTICFAPPHEQLKMQINLLRCSVHQQALIIDVCCAGFQASLFHVP